MLACHWSTGIWQCKFGVSFHKSQTASCPPFLLGERVMYCCENLGWAVSTLPLGTRRDFSKDLVASVVLLMFLALLEVFDFYWIQEADYFGVVSHLLVFEWLIDRYTFLLLSFALYGYKKCLNCKILVSCIRLLPKCCFNKPRKIFYLHPCFV